uniref:(northern house mosquito) hypothetical protein n=1 Tax=Culex pipiens TaxID=7175 RepID=A0A8D8BC29_CULPI
MIGRSGFVDFQQQICCPGFPGTQEGRCPGDRDGLSVGNLCLVLSQQLANVDRDLLWSGELESPAVRTSGSCAGLGEMSSGGVRSGDSLGTARLLASVRHRP